MWKGENMRLDKFLCEMNLGTRSQVKSYVRRGQASVNGVTAVDPQMKIREGMDEVAFRGQILCYRKNVYYMLNKPAGVVSATRDNTAPTVVSLLKDCGREGLFPVGRLDKDTEGLLLLTDDGELAHRLLSPRKHVDKTYQVTVERSLETEDILRLEQGVDIGEEKPTLPARVQVLEDSVIRLTIQEGKFHQVKRMLQAVNRQVLALKRVSFGALELDQSLEPGQYRELTPEEILSLQDCGDGENSRDRRNGQDA